MKAPRFPQPFHRLNTGTNVSFNRIKRWGIGFHKIVLVEVKTMISPLSALFHVSMVVGTLLRFRQLVGRFLPNRWLQRSFHRWWTSPKRDVIVFRVHIGNGEFSDAGELLLPRVQFGLVLFELLGQGGLEIARPRELAREAGRETGFRGGGAGSGRAGVPSAGKVPKVPRASSFLGRVGVSWVGQYTVGGVATMVGCVGVF